MAGLCRMWNDLALRLLAWVTFQAGATSFQQRACSPFHELALMSPANHSDASKHATGAATTRV